MKSELAERLLAALMDWDVPRFAIEVARVQAMASMKYDEYGGYRPGVKFAENLARWLEQFHPEGREIAYAFVMGQLVYISDVEMSHLIDIAYPDVLEQRLLTRAAVETSTPRHNVNQLASSPQFSALRRRTLVVGLSDGARLDRLRRATPLSHEQFVLGPELDSEQAERLRDALTEALKAMALPGDPSFNTVLLVDDFAGSGRTLLRENDDRTGFKGKLWNFKARLEEHQTKAIIAKDADVCVLLYAASEQALVHLEQMKTATGLPWDIDAIQLVAVNLHVNETAPQMAELCREFYDPSTEDQHKKETPLGYEDCGLPLILSHNTPNNSVCLLWAETSGEKGLGRRALFPRYERHHKDRP